MTTTQTTAPLTRRQAREIERRTGIRPIATPVASSPLAVVSTEAPASFRHGTGRIERNALASLSSVVPTEIFDRQEFGKQLAEHVEAQQTERGMTVRASVPAALVAKRRRRTAVTFAAAASAAAALSTGVLVPAAQSNQAADAHAADLAAATAQEDGSQAGVAETADAPVAEQVITEVVEAPATVADRGDITSFDGGVDEGAVTNSSYNTPVFNVSNPYPGGQCTWWAFHRRAELGIGISGAWDNANQWASQAAGSGYTVDDIPTVGAIAASQAGPYGHVAVVEAVERGVSVTISEGNYAGRSMGSERVLSWSEAMQFSYIH